MLAGLFTTRLPKLSVVGLTVSVVAGGGRIFTRAVIVVDVAVRFVCVSDCNVMVACVIPGVAFNGTLHVAFTFTVALVSKFTFAVAVVGAKVNPCVPVVMLATAPV